MKTEGMAHQLKALAQSERRSFYGYLMEQGTGKTWVDMADTEEKFGRGVIDAFMIAAPRGVHTNWTRREIPTHMSAPHVAGAWRSGMGVTERKALNKLLEPQGDKLRIFAINYDALITKDGRKFAEDFLRSARAGAKISADESQRIKTPTTARTKAMLELRDLALVRRIDSGTPITKNPGDAFSQFQFLREGVLGTSNYRAFFAEYAQLLNAQNPTTEDDWRFRKEIAKNPRMAFALRVARDDVTGMPIYRNLQQLADIIAKHSFRVLKKDCLDLPPKAYSQRWFELSGKQQAAYNLMESELRIMLEDGSLSPVSKLAALVKLQQITSGYVIVPGRDEPMYVAEDNPRLNLLVDTLEDIEGKVIIWARFKEEIAAIARALRAAGRKVVEYHGGVKERDREAAIDDFQEGDADTFLGNAAAGGMGITLTAANVAIYFSNSFDSEHRRQSEDRNHRKGTKGDKVLYIDLTCHNSIDESIVRSLQQKFDLAATIMGDRKLDVRGVDFTDNS